MMATSAASRVKGARVRLMRSIGPSTTSRRPGNGGANSAASAGGNGFGFIFETFNFRWDKGPAPAGTESTTGAGKIAVRDANYFRRKDTAPALQLEKGLPARMVNERAAFVGRDSRPAISSNEHDACRQIRAGEVAQDH